MRTFLKQTELELDIDSFDLHAVHYGLFCGQPASPSLTNVPQRLRSRIEKLVTDFDGNARLQFAARGN
jgi:hypothetical protein